MKSVKEKLHDRKKQRARWSVSSHASRRYSGKPTDSDTNSLVGKSKVVPYKEGMTGLNTEMYAARAV